MIDDKMIDYLKNVVDRMPEDWLRLTTHRLDIYNEELAKTEFISHFEDLFDTNNSDPSALANLPTAYDYIRLGHPLSCILEWAIAQSNGFKSENVISFASQTMPILAILRKNLLEDKKTQIIYSGELPESFNAEVIRSVYGYQFDLNKIDNPVAISRYNGSTIFVSFQNEFTNITPTPMIDFYINIYDGIGSVILVNGELNEHYTSEIQHVRRRETVAMTPKNSLFALKSIIAQSPIGKKESTLEADKSFVLDTIKTNTHTESDALIGSSGLSIQYAITMGLIHDAIENHPGKDIKIIVPPNCYGGTNDQARRVAACMDNVEVMDLPVDGDNDMTRSIDQVLTEIACEDAVPFIIAEIPTNPRVEVPDLVKLKEVLSASRLTKNGNPAIDPVFILDQTFCPNVNFVGEDSILSSIRTISYSSGSKFASGGRCNTGYCLGNKRAGNLMDKIGLHLSICDNGATSEHLKILVKQLPSMHQRIIDAYRNTREFVNFINETLPDAKINFVSEELAAQGFTPSVFSLDLPTKGDSEGEREAYKRSLNHKLINLMITEIPTESKYCVSYGQLKGCYWTIPATSTQGTTKEGDKDYIARVALSPDMDLELHKKVFLDFVNSI